MRVIVASVVNIKDAMTAFEQGGPPKARARQPVTRPRAVIYARVSTDEQEQSPEAQEHACRAFAARMGIDVVAVVQDVGTSGGAELDKRAKLIEALEALQEHTAQVFLVTKRDRLARSVIRSLFVERLVERARAQVMTADGVAGGSSPEEKLLRTMLDAFAEYERAVIRIRTKTVMGAKRRKNERIGQVPYGFRAEFGEHDVDDNGERKRGGKLIPVPAEQAAVRHICELRAGGASWGRVVEEMNISFANVARGAQWHRTTVTRVYKAELERRGVARAA